MARTSIDTKADREKHGGMGGRTNRQGQIRIDDKKRTQVKLKDKRHSLCSVYCNFKIIFQK